MPSTKSHENFRTGKTCPGCRHSHFPFGVAHNRIGNCLFNPPTASVIGMGAPSVIQKPQPDQLQPVLRAFFPVVAFSDSCSRFEPAPEADYSPVERLPVSVDNPSNDAN